MTRTILLLLHVIAVRVSSSASCQRSSHTSSPLLSGLLQLYPRQFRRRFDPPFLIDPSRNSGAPLMHFSNGKLLERLRGGATSFGGNRHASKDSIKPASKTSIQEVVAVNNSKRKAVKLVLSLATILTLATVLSQLNMDTLKPFFDREAIIQFLNHVKAKKNGLLFYTFGFACWEVCGLSTAVVETAAGVVFGFRHGLVGSFIGKTCGSIVAFTLGRTLLSDRARQLLENNASFEVIQRGFAKNPILSAFVVRYSPFPQLIKNYALSMTASVSYPMFVLAAIVHGFPFSCLWAAVGNDASLRLRASEMGDTMAANIVLNWSMVFFTIFGFIISPVVTGWWLADLRKEKIG